MLVPFSSPLYDISVCSNCTSLLPHRPAALWHPCWWHMEEDLQDTLGWATDNYRTSGDRRWPLRRTSHIPFQHYPSFLQIECWFLGPFRASEDLNALLPPPTPTALPSFLLLLTSPKSPLAFSCVGDPGSNYMSLHGLCPWLFFT